MPEGALRGQPCLAAAVAGAGSRSSEILVDDHHACRRPAEAVRTLGEGVLAGGGFAVMLDLAGGRLADVDHGLPVEVAGADLTGFGHDRSPRSPRRRPWRSAAPARR